MANYGPASAFLVVGGCDVSGLTYSLDESVEQVVEECRGLSVNWDRSLPAQIGRVALEAAPGLYDDAAALNNEAYSEQGTTRQLVAFGFTGKNSGAQAVIMNGDYTAVFNRIAKKEGLTLAGAKHSVTGSYLRGIVAGGFTPRSGTGNTEAASNDNTSATATGYTADLHVPALFLDGGTNVVVKVRHSVDNVVWADLATFAAVTVPGSSERLTAASPTAVNRYLSITWTFTGGAAPTGTFLVAFSRTQAT